MICIIKIVIFITTIPIIAGRHFGYSKRDQHIWVKNFKLCSGKLQSPISLSSFKSVALPLPALEVIGYHDFLPNPLYLKNSGHSVVINVNNHLRKELPYIFGGSLDANQEYEIDHLHFHWGAKNNRGSEHILNGIRYPMEMHIVHRNKIYSNLSNASNYKNGLVVLGIFFQLQEEDNESLHSIVSDLMCVQGINRAIKLSSPITLASLLPKNIDIFYTYKGSLTTPPCNEVVTWIIFPTPVPISFTQLNKFRSLSNGKDMLADNFRKLQNIGLRKTYVRRLNPLLIAKYNGTIFNAENLDWFWH
ncbi:PREDICTED: putative carbonic anhydrase 3 [Eufriesea mexicana]|uniref:putative carbonic anhydrase 3 n=1 Tax=Eufriesea mexicana TaxID=516756 RepID=UPI00083BE79C|nr:PREDICTED: putative carbonic anhydrase 3 [Eufriesea mexicana]